MTDASQKKPVGLISPLEHYSSDHTWTLYHWSRIFDSLTKRGVKSIRFNLNGTPGYTCTFSLCVLKSDWYFVVEFSDILGIEILLVDVCDVSGNLKFLCKRDKPISKRLRHPIGQMMNQRLSSNIYLEDTLQIQIKITILRDSDVISCPRPTAASPMVLSTSDFPPPNIPAKLKTMFEEKTLCDVTFVLGDEKFYAHKVVLAAHSQVFEAMFSNGMTEQKDNIINVADTEAEVFRLFLNYLYSGQVTELEKVVERMIVIADFYDVSHLKIMCEHAMLKSLSENSVIRYVILANELNCQTLKNEALCFIRKKATVLEKALLEEDVATVMCLKEVLAKNQPEV